MDSATRPEIVTSESLSDIRPNIADHAALKSGLVPRLRMLRLVVERLPKHFIPYKQEPSYKIVYYVERLSCGHERTYYPQAGPMSRRRHCTECASLSCGRVGTLGRSNGRPDGLPDAKGNEAGERQQDLPTGTKKPVSSSQDEQEQAA